MNNENRRTQSSEAVEIDLLELFSVLLHWIWLIVLAAIVVGGIAFAISKFAIPEEFQSTTRVYVLNRTEDKNDMPTYQELQASTQLTKDYSEMITSRHVLEKVISDLGLDLSYEGLKKRISVTTPSDSRIIQISVRDNNPAEAQRICRAVREESSEHIQNVMAIDAINIVDDANLPDHKSSPNNTRNTIIGALIGGFLAALIVVIRHFMDDTIKTNDDVEEYLGISCLAIIPLDKAVNVGQQKGKKKK